VEAEQHPDRRRLPPPFGPPAAEVGFLMAAALRTGNVKGQYTVLEDVPPGLS